MRIAKSLVHLLLQHERNFLCAQYNLNPSQRSIAVAVVHLGMYHASAHTRPFSAIHSHSLTLSSFWAIQPVTSQIQPRHPLLIHGSLLPLPLWQLLPRLLSFLLRPPGSFCPPCVSGTQDPSLSAVPWTTHQSASFFLHCPSVTLALHYFDQTISFFSPFLLASHILRSGTDMPGS